MDFPKVDFPASEASLNFQTEAIQFEFESFVPRWSAWIQKIIQVADCQLVYLSYIFCSDAYLHRINRTYLQHDTYTDIITFPYQEPPMIEGDIMISLDRVRENAKLLSENFDQELARVIIHGVLHLCGQKDKTEAEAQEMRRKEDEALALLAKM